MGRWARAKQERWEDERIEGFRINECPDYEYNYHFKVKLPQDAQLSASTINEGDVIITGITNTIKANNVNGNIDIKGAKNIKCVNTINGYIKVVFTENPTINGSYQTINGDITLMLRNKLNTQVHSKSMNGEIYSAFDYKYLKPTVKVNKTNRGRGTTYSIGQATGIVIGNGGPEITIETLNGDMFLKKI